MTISQKRLAAFLRDNREELDGWLESARKIGLGECRAECRGRKEGYDQEDLLKLLSCAGIESEGRLGYLLQDARDRAWGERFLARIHEEFDRLKVTRYWVVALLVFCAEHDKVDDQTAEELLSLQPGRLRRAAEAVWLDCMPSYADLVASREASMGKPSLIDGSAEGE